MATRLDIYNNEGSIVKRAVNYMKASWDNYSVYITDLATDTTWQYDAYHSVLEEGEYSLQFMNQAGEMDYHRHNLRITSQSPETIYIVFSYSKFLSMLSVKEVTVDKINELASQKKLIHPLGYNG